MMKHRIVGGVSALAVACAGGALAVSQARSVQTPQRHPASAVAAPPAPLSFACGGKLQRTVAEGVNVGEVNESIKVRSWIAAASTEGRDAPRTRIDGGRKVPAVGKLAFSSSESPLEGTVSTDSVATGSAELAAGTFHSAAAGDLRGIAMNPCQRPSLDQWIVGSSAKVGVSNQLILANPGAKPVTVSVAAHAGIGKAELGADSTVVVPAGQTKRVLLDGSLSDQDRVAFHVTAQSGGVAVSMQSTALDGYTPAGVSFVTPSQAGRSLTVPGVRIDDAAGAASLRIVNPNNSPVSVNISTFSEAGKKPLPGGEAVKVAPGAVLDLSLEGLPAGQTSVSVEASAPVAVGARSTSRMAEGAPADDAWAAARPAATSGSAVYGAAKARIAAVAGARRADVVATPISESGREMAPVRASIGPDSQGVLELPEGSVAVRYESNAPVSAAVATSAEVNEGVGIDWVPLASSGLAEESRRIALG